MYPHHSVYAKLFNDVILRLAASGLDLKIANDLTWDLQRGQSQALLDSQKSKSLNTVEERKLNLVDTEGMFLLMAVGYVIAGSVLFSEIVGGCAKSCRAFMRRRSVSEGGVSRGSSAVSSIQRQSDETRTFTEKLKHNIRRRLRPKPEHQQHTDVQSDAGEPSEHSKSETVASIPDKPEEPPALKGSVSFCTLKRIMLMRKQRKEEKKAAQKELGNNITLEVKEQQANELSNKLEYHIDVDVGAISVVSNVTIKNEKGAEIDDSGSVIDSSSIYSDPQIIKEETEAEINRLPVDSDRENNPSKEFGELV